MTQNNFYAIIILIRIKINTKFWFQKENLSKIYNAAAKRGFIHQLLTKSKHFILNQNTTPTQSNLCYGGYKNRKSRLTGGGANQRLKGKTKNWIL